MIFFALSEIFILEKISLTFSEIFMLDRLNCEILDQEPVFPNIITTPSLKITSILLKNKGSI